MSTSKRKYSFLVLMLGIFLVTFLSFTAQANAVDPGKFSGYAWSPNIGWISMNGVSFNTNFDALGGNPYLYKDLSGYAWSPNVGWISFQETTGCPSGNCRARINFLTESMPSGSLSGWARVLSMKMGTTPPENNDKEIIVDTGAPQDWADGWISLRGANYGVICPVPVDIKDNPDLGASGICSNVTNSKAWGSNVLGWIDFSPVTVQFPGAQVILEEDRPPFRRNSPIDVYSEYYQIKLRWWRAVPEQNWNWKNLRAFGSHCSIYVSENNGPFNLTSKVCPINSSGETSPNPNRNTSCAKYTKSWLYPNSSLEYYVECATYANNIEGNPIKVKSNNLKFINHGPITISLNSPSCGVLFASAQNAPSNSGCDISNGEETLYSFEAQDLPNTFSVPAGSYTLSCSGISANASATVDTCPAINPPSPNPNTRIPSFREN